MDPIWHLRSFQSQDINNFTGWKNTEYDKLVEEIAGLPSGRERLKRILRAEKILTDEEAIVIPIYHAWQTHLVSDRVAGYRANPANMVMYEEVSLK